MSKTETSAFAQSNPYQFSNQNSSEYSHLEFFETENRGFLRLPFSLLEKILKCGRTRSEVLVLFCILRYTLGFHREEFKATQSFIVRWTGLDPSSVKRALRDLVARNIVEKSKSSFDGKNIPGKGIYFRLSKVFEVQDAGVSCTGQAAPILDFREHAAGGKLPSKSAFLGADCTHKKEKPFKEKESFFNFKSEILKEYFSEIENSSKFFPEKRNFLKLTEMKSELDIEQAFKFLKKNGTVGKAKKCPVPMAYLIKSIDRVLELDQIEKKQRDQAKREFSQRKKMLEKKKKLWEQGKLIEKEFNKAFPTSELQESFIERFISEKFKGAFSPSSDAVKRVLAIKGWGEKFFSQVASSSSLSAETCSL